MEIIDAKQDSPVLVEEPFRTSHQVAMSLVVASAAQGSRVLLLDTGNGTEIGKITTRKCGVC
jgi:hypothetical protein